MFASKIVIFLVLVFILTVCNSCDSIQGYSAVCEGEKMSVKISFRYRFRGIVYTNGLKENQNCSSLLSNASWESKSISLELPFLYCNTPIRHEKQMFPLATNEVTIQFNKRNKSKLDCKIIATCVINYFLPRNFIKKYIMRKRDLLEDIYNRLSKLDATKPAVNINPSTVFQEKTSTRQNESDKITQLDKEISTGIYMPEILENISVVRTNQDVTKHSYEISLLPTILNSNFSETKTHERLGKRSTLEAGTNYSDTISPINVHIPFSGSITRRTFVHYQFLPTFNYTDYFNPFRSLDEDAGMDDESMELMNGTDCVNTSCFPNEDAGALEISTKFKNNTACFDIPCIPDEDFDALNTSKKVMNGEGDDCFNSSCRPDDDAGIILVTENLVIKDSSLKLDEMTTGSSDLNFTVTNVISLATDTPHKKDSVLYWKFVTVTTALSVLCGCSLIVALYLILNVRKERKKFNSHCENVYTDFQL